MQKRLSYEERHRLAKKHFASCIPTEKCFRKTPYGDVDGMQCPITDKLYHNTTVMGLQNIVADGKIRIMGPERTAIGQDAISTSPCPAQHYGGNVKLVIDAKGLDARPTCYYEYEGHEHIDRGVEKEATQKINGSAGVNRVRSNYAINLSIYNEECEAVVYNPIPVSKIKAVEYWIPWRFDEKHSYSTRCTGSMPHYAHSDYGAGMKILQEGISEARQSAKKIGAKFSVKSCFTALKPGWGNEYIPLSSKNLNMFAKGVVPPLVQAKKHVPEKCRC